MIEQNIQGETSQILYEVVKATEEFDEGNKTAIINKIIFGNKHNITTCHKRLTALTKIKHTLVLREIKEGQKMELVLKLQSRFKIQKMALNRFSDN